MSTHALPSCPTRPADSCAVASVSQAWFSARSPRLAARPEVEYSGAYAGSLKSPGGGSTRPHTGQCASLQHAYSLRGAVLPASTDIVAGIGSRARRHEHCKREQCKWEQRKWEQCKWEQRKWEQAKAAPASMGALFHVGYLQLQTKQQNGSLLHAKRETRSAASECESCASRRPRVVSCARRPGRVPARLS